MGKIFLLLIVSYVSILLSEDITFSDTTYTTKDFILGLDINSPKESLFADSIFSYPQCKPLDADSLFLYNKYFFIMLYSPYPCSNCYHANFEIINSFAKKYPNQVFIVVEYWEMRDVINGLKKLNLDDNIKIILDKEGKNILKLSELDDEFINAGFVVVNNQSKIKYILLGSFKYPYSSNSLKKLSVYVDEYLKIK